MDNSIAYLHSIGLSQRELTLIDTQGGDFGTIFDRMSHETLIDLGVRSDRIPTILTAYSRIQTANIDRLLASLTLVTLHDVAYPPSLRQIPRPPYLLYVRGILPISECLAIVGSRKHTDYSRRVLDAMIPPLVHTGHVVVSGGAAGVDTLAHTITLRENGTTVSVMGTGIDTIYPRENAWLFETIVEHGGALISQFRLGETGKAYNFPIRNETIVGLSRGILIPEAGEQSGTLITARLALENNRDVFVVPGDIFRPTSAGTGKLLRDGLAKAVLGADDILVEYADTISGGQLSIGNTSVPDLPSPSLWSEEEKQVYEMLRSTGATDASSLCESLDMDVSDVVRILSDLEVYGYVRRDTYGKYRV